jgi:hypothetical protein
MTKAEHEARVRKMLAGRGLKPKPKKTKPPTARSVAIRKAVRSHWKKMTPAERQARVARMLAGRGLKPKGKAKAK